MTKFAIIIPDGAADYPLEEFGGRTALEAAHIPNIDAISIEGKQGMVQTIPDGMQAGSDVAQMSLLGYNPKESYSGRAPIEAAAQDIEITPEDWVLRCNLVTLSDMVMADHSAGHISTDEARQLIGLLAQALNHIPNIRFYAGVSYRHLCVVSDTNLKVKTTPPHDIIGKKISKYLPKGKGARLLNDIIKQSQELFKNHEINRVRRDLGENPVSSIWLWGQGQKAVMERFSAKFGVTGAAITAVDLVRGLAKLVHFDLLEVEGATGYIDTNYKGKAEAAIKALEDHDLVYVHIEGPDEAGHNGDAAGKKKGIELIDKHIIGPVHEALKQYENYRILVLPDHPTPCKTRTHTSDPVPFAMAGEGVKGLLHKPFSESNALEAGFKIERGCDMMEYFLKV